MQTKILKNITVLFALLFSVSLFAQNIEVEEINKKIELSPEDGTHIRYLAFGAASSVFINEGTADKHQRSWEGILTANLENATELTSVTGEFGGELHDIEMINIVWDGSTPFSFDQDALNKLPELKYVFVRSYEKIDKNTILSSLPSLLTQLENKGGVIVLYQTIETAQ